MNNVDDDIKMIKMIKMMILLYVGRGWLEAEAEKLEPHLCNI